MSDRLTSRSLRAYSESEISDADELAYVLTVTDFTAVERDDLRAEYRTNSSPVREDVELVAVSPTYAPRPPIRYLREELERSASDEEVRRARVDT